ncbi:hypothetical protein MIDIC_70021 [Alphaproteobacteria bacterium]
MTNNCKYYELDITTQTMYNILICGDLHPQRATLALQENVLSPSVDPVMMIYVNSTNSKWKTATGYVQAKSINLKTQKIISEFIVSDLPGKIVGASAHVMPLADGNFVVNISAEKLYSTIISTTGVVKTLLDPSSSQLYSDCYHGGTELSNKNILTRDPNYWYGGFKISDSQCKTLKHISIPNYLANGGVMVTLKDQIAFIYSSATSKYLEKIAILYDNDDYLRDDSFSFTKIQETVRRCPIT